MSKMNKVLAGVTITTVTGVAVLTVFGDNFRRMFGGSVNCLANSSTMETGARKASDSSAHRNITDFASRSTSQGETGYAAPRVAYAPTPAPAPEPQAAAHPEENQQLAPNAWTPAAEDRFSTFGADVDTASYTESRRALLEGRLPTADTVRVEEFVNYFKYDYPAPKHDPFAVYTDLAPSPFHKGHMLMRVGVQARKVALRDRKVMHLVLLVDTSGSMSAPDRLPLAREAMKLLVKNLSEHDTLSIVTYAGDTREVLPPTPAAEQTKILAAIDTLQTTGGTNMGSGMEMAYKNAVRDVRSGEVSRVIVLTDGDANIGNTGHESILKSVETYVKEGVTLSTIGFGTGNYRDGMLEQLADKGNGNNYYIDDLKQARRVFEEQLTGMLQVVAKDLKLQVEFNPAVVKQYKLLGYENRTLAARDFRNDKVDAGEVGAGHTVTALYELELEGQRDDLLATVRTRAKQPDGDRATEQAFAVKRDQVHERFEQAPASFRLATVAASFADSLRGNSEISFGQLAQVSDGLDSFDEDAAELKDLIQRAGRLSHATRDR
jgi:Ca-activated chloride channel family protein